MRILPNAVAVHLAARRSLQVHPLVWLKVREHNDPAAVHEIGFWTGADHQTIVVDGVARVYYGVGAVLGLDPITSQAQGHEQTWSLQVSSLHAQVVEALRVYDARLAPIEVHSWYLDPATDLPLADPVRDFRGTVLEVDLPTPPLGGEAIATLTCVSDAWRLTRGLSLRRSDSALQARAPGDRFRQYNAISGSVQVGWGEHVRTAAPVPPPPPRQIDPSQQNDR